MTDRATAWSLTINNPSSADDECIALARQKGWKVEGQKERGVTGTDHYQLLVKTPQVRFSAMKKAFPRAHIEVARNVRALETYVTKEDTRQGYLPSTQDKYPSMTRLWELISDYIYESDYSKYLRGPGDLSIPGSKREDKLMELFDDAITQLICDGYCVETLGVNPQIRCAWKKYSTALLLRVHRQTDRQTDSALEQSVEIPMDSSITNGSDDCSQGEDYSEAIATEDQSSLDGESQGRSEETDCSNDRG